MLEIGLIGDIQLLEPYVKKAQEHPEIFIAGKSTIGIPPRPGSLRIQAPEFNRIELIERSDALLINKFSLLPFHLVCNMVKKTKHIFATGYPDLSTDECFQLAKLANEAKTVIQVINPLYYQPAVLWLNKNIKRPSFNTITSFKKDDPADDFFLKMLLMLKDFLGTGPKKTGAVAFKSTEAGADFSNVQLELNDGSVIQFNLGKTAGTEEFFIKSYAGNQFVFIDFIINQFTSNGHPIHLTEFSQRNETLDFITSILHKKPAVTNIENYAMALQTKQTILDKLNRYLSC